MPTGGRRPDVLVDTSAAVALVVADHEHHEATAAALDGRRLGLAGHAAFETFSATSSATTTCWRAATESPGRTGLPWRVVTE